MVSTRFWSLKAAPLKAAPTMGRVWTAGIPNTGEQGEVFEYQVLLVGQLVGSHPLHYLLQQTYKALTWSIILCLKPAPVKLRARRNDRPCQSSILHFFCHVQLMQWQVATLHKTSRENGDTHTQRWGGGQGWKTLSGWWASTDHSTAPGNNASTGKILIYGRSILLPQHGFEKITAHVQ